MLLDKIVRVMGKKNLEENIVAGNCPSHFGLFNQYEKEDCPSDCSYETCELCWEKSLELEKKRGVAV